MGFLAYFLPQGMEFVSSDGGTEFTEKDYFFLDKIDINYIKNDIGFENISIKVGLNIYDSYEDRLTMVTPCMVKEFTIEGLIDKNFSANLWNICYGKIKEIVLNQNTQNLKEKLSLSDNDTITTEYQYLLEIEDHFN